MFLTNALVRTILGCDFMGEVSPLALACRFFPMEFITLYRCSLELYLFQEFSGYF